MQKTGNIIMIKLKELFDTSMPSLDAVVYKPSLNAVEENFKLVDSEGNIHEYVITFFEMSIAFNGTDLLYGRDIINDDTYNIFSIEYIEFAKYYYEDGHKRRTSNIMSGFSPFKIFASIWKILKHKLDSGPSYRISNKIINKKIVGVGFRKVGFVYAAHKGEGTMHYGREGLASREKLYDSFAKLINDKTEYDFIDSVPMNKLKYYIFLRKDFHKKLKDAKIELDLDKIVDNI